MIEWRCLIFCLYGLACYYYGRWDGARDAKRKAKEADK